MAFKFLHIDHIGIAVKDLEGTKEVFTKMGLVGKPEDEVVAEQKVKVSFFPCGDAELEFLESTSPDGPIAKYIAGNGDRNGIQHVAIAVDDIEAAIADMNEKGIAMIDKTPRYGAGGAKIAFLHPKATGGILVELCQH